MMKKQMQLVKCIIFDYTFCPLSESSSPLRAVIQARFSVLPGGSVFASVAAEKNRKPSWIGPQGLGPDTPVLNSA